MNKNNKELKTKTATQLEKYIKDLQIVWSKFFDQIKSLVSQNVDEVHNTTSLYVNMPNRKDTYARYISSLWEEYRRRVDLHKDKDIWEFHLLLNGESEESMKLKYNMLKNAKRDLKRELMLENGCRRKSSEQMAKEKRKISDNYKVMSSTHKGIGIDVYSCEYVSVNQFESKFKTSSRDILSIETNYNNVAAYEKNLETEELLESDCLNEKEKNLCWI